MVQYLKSLDMLLSTKTEWVKEKIVSEKLFFYALSQMSL